MIFWLNGIFITPISSPKISKYMMSICYFKLNERILLRVYDVTSIEI